MAYKKKEYKSGKSQEEKRKEIDLLVKQADEKIDKVFSSPNDLKEYLSFMAKFHNYSYRNSILIEEQFRGAVAVGSFAFWKEKGYSVNKGEKGIKILVPTKLGDRFIAEDGTIKLISKANEKEKQLIKSGELETLEGAIKFKQGYVFDVSQTNMPSSELPKIFPNKWLEGDVKNYKAFYKSLENVASKIGVKIIEPKSELGLVKGVSYTSTREVALNPRNSELQNVKTLIHELAHAKLHTVETRDNYTKAEKEFQAEMVALSVSSYFGINTEEYSLRYLSEWTKNATFKDKEKLLKEVSTTVKEYVEIMEDNLNAERELTKENELVNSLSDKNIKNESELNLEMEGEMDFESEKFIKIKDENIKEFLRTDKVVIHEVSKSELEELVDNNKSFIWFKTEKGSEVNSDIFTSENHVIVVKEKGAYQDVYVRKNYDLENLIYVDDKKNLYKVKNNENEGEINMRDLEKENLINDLVENVSKLDTAKANIRPYFDKEFDIEKIKNEIELKGIEEVANDLNVFALYYGVEEDRNYTVMEFKDYLNDRFVDEVKKEIVIEKINSIMLERDEMLDELREYSNNLEDKSFLGKVTDFLNSYIEKIKGAIENLREVFENENIKESKKYIDELGLEFEEEEFNINDFNSNTIVTSNEMVNEILACDRYELLNKFEDEMTQEDDIFLKSRGFSLEPIIDRFLDTIKDFDFDMEFEEFKFANFLEETINEIKGSEYEHYLDETISERYEMSVIGEAEYREIYGENTIIDNKEGLYVKLYSDYLDIDKDKTYSLDENIDYRNFKLNAGQEFKIKDYINGDIVIEVDGKEQSVSFSLLLEETSFSNIIENKSNEKNMYRSELIENHFNDLELSEVRKEKWIVDYFNENKVQDKVRDNLIKQEAFLELLENKIYADYAVDFWKNQIECFGKDKASDYYGNYHENDLSEEDKKLNKETEKRMETEFNELNESLKKKEIELSNLDNQLNEFVETVEKNIDKFEKGFNIEYNSKSEIEINTNEVLNSDIEKMEVLKDRIDKENRLGRDQSKDCRIDYGILKTFSERFNEKVELLDKLGINHAGIEKIDKEEIVKYSEKAKFPEVGEVKIFKSESMHFKENQILTFNEANSLFEKEEAYVRDLKREYEKKGEYYPYEKVKGEVKINDNVDFEFRYDIGEGEFYNLADLLERKLSNTNHQYAIKDFLIEKGVRENDKEERGINDIVSNLNYEKEEELERQ
ncbi:ImmA/IrrE family metallo-endopeptidase [Clostridium perfringens]|uniref:ImmA/IrrE family metallo-endopeptidase n=3 Tax=Clostridium perfringens TaxID=1502 RepID=UPI000AFB5458|nr:ImmA/IrrE family metallo-endopeptidase [Clostridium perfringens]